MESGYHTAEERKNEDKKAPFADGEKESKIKEDYTAENIYKYFIV